MLQATCAKEGRALGSAASTACQRLQHKHFQIDKRSKTSRPQIAKCLLYLEIMLTVLKSRHRVVMLIPVRTTQAGKTMQIALSTQKCDKKV
jgi:hypothetical protein